MIGALARAIGAPYTAMLSGVFCLAGAAWFATQLSSIRKYLRPIYRDLGILPPITAVVQDSVGR